MLNKFGIPAEELKTQKSDLLVQAPDSSSSSGKGKVVDRTQIGLGPDLPAPPQRTGDFMKDIKSTLEYAEKFKSSVPDDLLSQLPEEFTYSYEQVQNLSPTSRARRSKMILEAANTVLQDE